MQLSGIIAILLLSQYEVSSSHNGRFAQELELFQNSLVAHIYDDTSLDPEEDNDEIEDIANAILEEADRRLKKRELIKHQQYNHKDADDDERGDNKLYRDKRHKERHKAYDAVSDAYSDILKLYNANSQNDKININENKREVYQNDDKKDENVEQNKEYKKQVREQKKTLALNIKAKRNAISQQNDNNVHKDEVKVSHNGDNNQVASVKVDNTPDIQTRLANSAEVGKRLFFEPNANVNSTKVVKPIPPKKITTNKVDRSGLDEFSFIAVIVGCCVAGIAGIGLASFCWYKLRSETKELKNGGTDFKTSSLRSSDRKKPSDEEKLARGAEVFHYLHAKKQMQQMEEPNLKSDQCSINESSDDEEDEDTVYECPGLAPPGDMKVVNPLFSDTESHYSDAPSLQSTPTPPSEEK